MSRLSMLLNELKISLPLFGALFILIPIWVIDNLAMQCCHGAALAGFACYQVGGA